MKPSIGYASEIYNIDPLDLISLQDTPAAYARRTDCSDPVVVLIGNRDLNIADTLICGREIISSALEEKQAYIPVRFAFISAISPWNWLPLFIKKLRYKYKFFNTRIYHLEASQIRRLKIERGIRTKENAYAITNKRWAISEPERVEKYNNLVNSLRQGFNDEYPISIMLCRRMGYKDCVDNGHHRLGICIEEGIERISTNFIAAGCLPHWLQKFILKFQRRQN